MEDSYYISFILKTSKINEDTKKRYVDKINIIQKHFYNNVSIEYILLNPQLFLDALEKYSLTSKGRISDNIGDHTKESFISPIKALFTYNQTFYEMHNEIFEQWNDIHKIIKEPIDQKYLSNKPTKRQESAYVTFEMLCDIRDKLPDGKYEKLLFDMYTLIPPVRNDYYDTLILYEKPQGLIHQNYIFLSSSENYLCLEVYKTVKTYKVKFIPLPDKLVQDIIYSLKIAPRNRLFLSFSHKPYTKENFNSWANGRLKALTGNNGLCLSMLRHIYITRRDLMLEEKSGLERKKIADIMCHSLEQQQKYLWHSWLKEIEINDPL